MTPPENLRPCIPPAHLSQASGEASVGPPAPTSRTAALVAAIFATFAWLGAACGGWTMSAGRDMPEGLLSAIGLRLFAASTAMAVVLTVVTAVALRWRRLSRAALVAGSLAVTGILVTSLCFRWA